MNKKTVLITGSSTGFGHATARLFADKGWNVVATMRNVSAAGDLARRDNVLVSRLDVTDPASIDAAIKTSIERFGKLDAVINNAGYGQYGIFETIPQKSIQSNFDVNLFGVMNVIRAIVPVFRKQQDGLILNVSSVGGLIGLPSVSIYLSTKFALGRLHRVSVLRTRVPEHRRENRRARRRRYGIPRASVEAQHRRWRPR